MICGQCGTLNENERDECVRCKKPLHPAGMKGKIACVNHGNREATTSCGSCGARLCPACAVNVNGIDYCENCAPEGATVDHEEDYERIAVIAPEKGTVASFGSRLLALLIDTAIIVVPAFLVVLVVFMFGGPFSALVSVRAGGVWFYLFWLLFLLIGMAYAAVMIAMSGQTVGKQVAGVIVLDPEGHVMDWKRSLARSAAALLSMIPFGLGFWWALWDANHETWHDKLAKTTAYRWEELT